jgi:hypothetical protein
MKKAFTILVLASLAFCSYGQFSLNLESGFIFPGYIDVRIPNNPETATKFSFTDDFDLDGPVIPLRVRLSYCIAGKNHFSLLFAPLGINYNGVQSYDLNFQETTFTAGERIDGFYKFNSYRLTYRRDVLVRNNWIVGVGFTAKIRDARVKLSNENNSAKKDDVGFVPLFNIKTSYETNQWMFMLEGDGLAGGGGRAFDIFLGSFFKLKENIMLGGGYRILEGGADVGEVYNFTLINFASLSFYWELSGLE